MRNNLPINVTCRYKAICRCLLLWGFMLPLSLSAQIKPIIQKGATRAVIIGISDYKNERITDLRFADVDARNFADYLSSPAGGNLPTQNIQLLTNEKATQGQMAAALTWLMDESKSGDQAIIYFSGHGDMETLTGMSFLLAHDASAAAYSGGGGFPIIFLQSIITRLSTQKQVQVLLVTDACRAGKLAGNEIGGSQATTKILSDQFSNEVKILSCQPNEFSLEGTEWGGGRGVFSYFLLDGLKGLADANQDKIVSLMEIGRFLEDKVPTATAPHSQIPMIVGNKGAQVAQVDAQALAALPKKENTASLTTIASRSGVEGVSIPEDTTAARLLRLYEIALAEGHLLTPESGSAYQLYQQLKDRPSMQAYIGLMRRNLAAQLQDEAQIAINDYLSADPRELRKRWGFDNRYEKFPLYLDKSAELLGPDHFMFQRLKSREHYFNGLNLRLAGERLGTDSLLIRAQNEQQKAVELDPTAVFAYNEMGHLALTLNQDQSSINHLNKAIALSPTWVLPWSNLCFSYFKLRDFTQAERCGLKALELDSNFVMANYNLGLIYQTINNHKKATYYYKKTLKNDPDYAKAYFNLGLSYYHLGDYKLSEKTWQDYRKRVPNDPSIYNNLGNVAIDLKDKKQAESYFQQAISLDPNYGAAILSLGELLAERGQFEKASSQFESYIKLEKEDASGFYALAASKAQQKQAEKALEYLEKALQLGYKDIDKLKANPAFKEVLILPACQTLLQKYFPN